MSGLRRIGALLAAGAAGSALGLWLTALAGSGPDAAAPLDPSAVDRLHALGYVDFAEAEPERGPDPRDGVVHRDPARMQPGPTLYTLRPLCRAELVDATGAVLRAWSRPCRTWERAELLPDGDLLVVARAEGDAESLDAVQASRRLLRFAWDGRLRWERRLPVHHDAEAIPDAEGRLLALTHRFGRLPESHAGLPVDDNGIALLSPDGELLEETSLLDALRRGGFPLRVPEVHRLSVDLLHANSLETVRETPRAGRHPLYTPGFVLVCIRNQDAIAVVDREAGRAVWWWGPGELSGPHDARMLPNGHVLVFDNGVARRRSRVVELDPLSREIVWQYAADDFYTRTRGSSQRLPNGNTLVSESDHGRGFEVTPEGERVWELLAPYRNAEGQRATLVRMERLAPERLARAGASRG